MPDYTITVDNVPFRVRGAKSREQAQRAVEVQFSDPQVRREAMVKRKAKLLDMGIDVDQNFATEGMGKGERFLVGAGRTFTETARGAKQMWYSAMGDEEKVQALQREESSHRDTFDMLDNEGIGMEDLGQLAPELVAFLGSGGGSALGTAASMGLRGAALGGSKATVEGESRGLNALVSGLLTAGAAGAASGVASMFRAGGTLTGAAAAGLNRLARGTKTKGDLVNNMSSALSQAQHLANSKDAAIRKVGQESLAQLTPLVQKMNSVGKESLFRTQLNQLMQASMQRGENALTLDTAKFVQGLAGVSKGTMIKELGRTYGTRLDTLRNTFTELTKVGDISGKQATEMLKGIMADDSAAAVAQQISRASQEGAKPGVMSSLMQTLQNRVQQYTVASAQAQVAGAGNGTADVVDDVIRNLSDADIRID
jgi:hypothetical protein